MAAFGREMKIAHYEKQLKFKMQKKKKSKSNYHADIGNIQSSALSPVVKTPYKLMSSCGSIAVCTVRVKLN